ncbi:hypothetical protein [Crocosphaera sp.]|uniref:hypothetical protein n=1 Tax=Crocosphaera sp. TaxID=2729996 RepID=UPI0026364A10|nr:hypothetical protein [Crocosphaera sp.]MDJ0579040.1 hypothetical protein [Crocosphaera sp.]
MSKSHLENRFIQTWNHVSDIVLEREVILIPDRKFRFDFVDYPSQIAIEIQGGIWSKRKKGHNGGTGLERDYEKLNLAQLNGWKVFLLSESMISPAWLTMIENCMLEIASPEVRKLQAIAKKVCPEVFEKEND